jgi:hypothetical protein
MPATIAESPSAPRSLSPHLQRQQQEAATAKSIAAAIAARAQGQQEPASVADATMAAEPEPTPAEVDATSGNGSSSPPCLSRGPSYDDGFMALPDMDDDDEEEDDAWAEPLNDEIFVKSLSRRTSPHDMAGPVTSLASMAAAKALAATPAATNKHAVVSSALETIAAAPTPPPPTTPPPTTPPPPPTAPATQPSLSSLVETGSLHTASNDSIPPPPPPSQAPSRFSGAVLPSRIAQDTLDAPSPPIPRSLSQLSLPPAPIETEDSPPAGLAAVPEHELPLPPAAVVANGALHVPPPPPPPPPLLPGQRSDRPHPLAELRARLAARDPAAAPPAAATPRAGLLDAIGVGVGLRPMIPAPRPEPLPHDNVASALRNGLRHRGGPVRSTSRAATLVDDPEVAPLLQRVQEAAQHPLPTLEAVDYFIADVDRLAEAVEGGEYTLEQLPDWPDLFVSDARDVHHSNVVVTQCLVQLEVIATRAQGENARISDVDLQAQHKRLTKTYNALCVDNTIVHAALDRLGVTAADRERVRQAAIAIFGQCLPLLFAKAESTRVSLQDPGLNKFDAGARVSLTHRLYFLYLELCRAVRQTFVSRYRVCLSLVSAPILSLLCFLILCYMCRPNPSLCRALITKQQRMRWPHCQTAIVT